jgi:hypothetical protein
MVSRVDAKPLRREIPCREIWRIEGRFSVVIFLLARWCGWLAWADAACLRLFSDEASRVEWDEARAWIRYPC